MLRIQAIKLSRSQPLALGKRYLSIQTEKPQAYLTPWHSFPHTDRVAEAEPEALEGVMCLVMDRAETKNALSVRMVNEMRESISRLSSTSDARILLLHTPHKNTFCSGADLRERKTMSQSQVDQFLKDLRAMLGELEAVKLPTIAVVDGFAMGGGCELALSCDIRVGGPNTKLSLPETKLGIIPGAGGTQRLTKLLGTAKAKELIFTGKRLDGIEAERIGLVNLCARDPSTAIDGALGMAKQILTSGVFFAGRSWAWLMAAPLALHAAKQAINAAPTLALSAGLDLERELYEPLLKSEDRMEGLRAFAEKRPARFQGR